MTTTVSEIDDVLRGRAQLVSDQREMLFSSLENFFEGRLRNPNTRRAYKRCSTQFLKFAIARLGVDRLEGIRPSHIASWLDTLTADGRSPATVKQRLAALVSLFDSLVEQQILARNPAKIVKGPNHVIHKGSTPVLTGGEMIQLLSAIDVSSLIGKRDRAMIATMAYSFARISAVTSLRVCHVFTQQRRLWLRVTDKGGKRKDIPCHHHLETYLSEWLDAAGHRETPDAPLFQTFSRRAVSSPPSGDATFIEGSERRAGRHPERTRRLSGKPMSQSMTWEMLQRRSRKAGLATHICNHTFRATGITAYLSNGGAIERAAAIAGHSSITTTKLYDRRNEDVTLDEIERIHFE